MGHVIQGVKDSGAWEAEVPQAGCKEYFHIHTSGELSRWDEDPFPVRVCSALAATI